mgnify:FL=1
MLLRDILAGEAPDIAAVADVIAEAAPDILALQGIDYDHGMHALGAFADGLERRGHSYPHRVALPSNAGLATGIDLDGDGRLGGPRDAQGYGAFAGAGAMAVLSRWPIVETRDFTTLLWADLPGNLITNAALSPEARVVQRLSSHGHWVITVAGPGDAALEIWTFHASPPVFDGPEDRNGRRNHDEAAFWLRHLEGAFGPAGERPVVLLGDFNLDPLDGEGRPDALNALRAHPMVQDPEPKSRWAAQMAAAEGGANTAHRGDPALDTANWRDESGPGNLRVDYVLPSRHWAVMDAGVTWAAPAGDGAAAPRHGLVWVDLVPAAAGILDPSSASR